MKTISDTQKIQLEPEMTAQACVIWLHGLGADGNDFVPIVRALKLPQNAGIRFIFPHAPMRPVTINGGYNMRAWYDIRGAKIEDKQDRSGIHQSHDIIQDLIDKQIQSGIPANKILLAGFSQGGAMTLHTGLRQNIPLAGLLVLSAYLPLHMDLPNELTPAAHATSLQMIHGEYDHVVPMNLAQTSKVFLESLGLKPAWQTYPMAHEVCQEEIYFIREFLLKSLGV